jgi:hypothetical protein
MDEECRQRSQDGWSSDAENIKKFKVMIATVWKAIMWYGNDSLDGSVVVGERREEINDEEYGVRIEWIGVY